MWHEARRQERKIRGMMVDYRRRAERRRDFYERIKADPTQFLQLHGRQCKIHLDPSIASAADSPATMMPWQGQADNLIDRFDVRAHLDYIPAVQNQEDQELTFEERQTNYERYRIIAQNSFAGITEEKFLKQLHMEEQFGYMEPESKKKKTGGAAIGFNYEDGTGYSAPSTDKNDDNSDANSDSDLDVDLYINVSKVDQFQAHELNKHGLNFGMSSNDLYSFLTDDMEEAETNRLAREEEHEKALFSGRKSRRERRAHREKRLANRVLSPPSYAARASPTYPTFRDSNSASRSPSPANAGKITYITSFGGDDEAPTTSKASTSNKLKRDRKFKRHLDSSPANRIVTIDNSEREKSYRRKRRSNSSESRNSRSRRHSRSRRRSRSRDRYRRYPYSRTRKQQRYRSRRSTSSSSYSSRSKTRNRSYSRSRYSRRVKSSTSSSSSRSSSASRKSSHSTRKLNKSRSPSIKRESPPKITVQRYYGRKRSDQSSSSDLEDINDPEETSCSNNQMDVDKEIDENNAVEMGNADTASNKTVQTFTVTTMSVQERLRRKRQALLNKQYKADKLAEQQKTDREKQEQQNREDELREMAIKLRRRQRELRHAYESNSTGSSSESDGKNSSASSTYKNKKSSRSPTDKESESVVKGDKSYPTSSRNSPICFDETKDDSSAVNEKEIENRRWEEYWNEFVDSKKDDNKDINGGYTERTSA